jgi:8-oxo-dGTP diphosphatase
MNNTNWSKSSLSRHMNIPASYLVLINQDEKVLLLRRFNTGFKDGMYSLVAGHVDNGETFKQTLIRESFEESGIKFLDKDIKIAHVMHRKSNTDNSERVDTFFVVKNWSGEVTNCEPHKCDELVWHDFDNLPENTIDYVKAALKNIQQGVFYSEFGW